MLRRKRSLEAPSCLLHRSIAAAALEEHLIELKKNSSWRGGHDPARRAATLESIGMGG